MIEKYTFVHSAKNASAYSNAMHICQFAIEIESLYLQQSAKLTPVCVATSIALLLRYTYHPAF